MSQPLGSRYLLHEMLGRGAMGQVFRASVRDVETPVAVKLLKPELVADPELVARFIQERSILTSISHPNVVQIVDLVVEGDTLGIVMEYVPGQDLRHYLRRQGTLPPAEAAELTAQILNGLTAVHAADIIHRDIKPENLLLNNFGGHTVVKLTDFGVARLSYGTSLTKRTSLIGTPEYMSPELADGGSVTPAADLYSIGILLYEMLSGDTPFTGGHPLAVLRRHVDQPPAPLTGIPVELWDYIDWLLAKDPRSRPRSASEAAAALAGLQPRLAGLAALPRVPAQAQAPEANSYPSANRSALADLVSDTRPSTPWGTGFEGRPVTAFPTGDRDGTVTRRRDRGYGPGEDYEPSASGSGPGRGFGAGQPRFVPDLGPDRAATPGSGRKQAPADAPATGWTGLRRRISSRPMVLALPATLVVLAAAIGFILVRPHGTATATTSSTTVSYAFPAGEYSDGLTIVRHWELSGDDGSLLTETVTASSAGSSAVQLPFEEVIPKTIAASLKTVQFSPAVDKVIRADPVVEWQLKLPSGHRSITVGYRATVPAKGLSVARLRQWAKDLTTEATQLHVALPTAITINSLSVSPGTVNLKTGATTQLKLSGKLASGGAVSAQILSGAGWTTSNAAVASVSSSGKVTAAGPGKATVTVQIGSTHAAAIVTVAKSASNLAAGNAAGPGSVRPAAPAQPSGGISAPKPSAAPGGNGNGNGGSNGGSTKATAPIVKTTTTKPITGPATTYLEVAYNPASTYTSYSTAGGTEGSTINSQEGVEVSCRVAGAQEAEGNDTWYRIADSPWNNAYYAFAGDFWNGAPSGSPNTIPYDSKVPLC